MVGTLSGLITICLILDSSLDSSLTYPEAFTKLSYVFLRRLKASTSASLFLSLTGIFNQANIVHFRITNKAFWFRSTGSLTHLKHESRHQHSQLFITTHYHSCIFPYKIIDFFGVKQMVSSNGPSVSHSFSYHPVTVLALTMAYTDGAAFHNYPHLILWVAPTATSRDTQEFSMSPSTRR